MKIQALTTTLAVLLAVSLAAIVALVVSSDVLGSEQVIADTPAAIQIDVVNPQTPDADSSTTEVADQTAAEERPTDTTTAEDPAPVDTTDEPTPVDPAPTPADPPVDPAPADPEPPVDPAPADPVPVEPPCDGTVIDGNCVPPISILCLLGYERVGNDCLFVGCPLGFQLNDGVCETLVLTLPCPAGFFRNDAGACVPQLVFDPPVFEPVFCLDGFTRVDGECVSICPPDTQWVGGFCLPQFDFDPIQLPEFDLAAIGG